MTETGSTDRSRSLSGIAGLFVEIGGTEQISCDDIGIGALAETLGEQDLAVLRWPLTGTILFNGQPLDTRARLSAVDFTAGRIAYQHQSFANDEILLSTDKVVFGAMDDAGSTVARLPLVIEIAPPSRVSPDAFIELMAQNTAS